jgi:hypothetical protein
MVTPVIKNTFLTTYRDDWKDSDNYYRILFNNGRSLQARELTQLQTILQNQITKNGNFLFKDGSPISGGQVHLNISVEYVKLNTTVLPLPTNPSSIIGDTFTGSTSGLKVRVNRVISAEGSDPATLYISYIDNNGQVAADTTQPLRLRANETIVGASSGVTLRVQSVNTSVNPCVGRGSTLSVLSGTYYVAGHYVFADNQTIVLDKYSNIPTGNVGFIVTEDIVTASDNIALYDNSGPNPNLSAPGADRYRIRLTLTKESDTTAGDNYFSIATIQDGYIVTQVDEGSGSMLNTVGNILATRTKEESGNYIVRPFIVNPVTNVDSSDRLDINIEPGLAYVNGYRVETLGKTKIVIPKPRTTTLFNNQVSAANYGNYVTVTTLRGIPTINTLATVNLRSAVTYGGSTIGTARIRSIEKNGANYNLYLFDVIMSTGQSFRNVRSIGTSTTNYGDVLLVDGVATIIDTSNNNLFFDLPNYRPSEISDIVLTTQRRFNATTDGAGSVTLTAGTGETFDDASLWITVTDSDGVVRSPSISILSPFTSAVLSGLPASKVVSVAGFVRKSAGSVKTKTLTNRTATFTPVSGVVTLDRADVYRINAVRQGSVSGVDVSDRYTFFNGQTDNFYGPGTLTLRTNQPAPVGNIYVDFDFFTHGAGGDFFAVNSYTGQIPYENIPSHTTANGSVVSLRDVLDFRPREDNTGANFTGTGAVRMELPRNTALVTFDARYYDYRRGFVSINANGGIYVITGDASATNPKWPALPANSIEQYRFTLNPYMINDSDMTSQYSNHRHYTMAQIGEIEDRLNKLEEFTTLTLLELETANAKVYDSNGVDRLKAGFTADNFSTHAYSDTRIPEYRASVDFNTRELRPEFIQRTIELVYDSSMSTSTTLKGDTVYMNYTEVPWKAFTAVSRPEDVTAFEISKMVGDIKLSPASDNWFDEDTLPAKTINGGSDLDVSLTKTWAGWNGNWSGWTEDEITNLKVGDVLNTGTVTASQSRTYTSGNFRYTVQDRTKYTNKVTSQSFVTVPGERIITQTSIPFQRSKFVFFRATQLRPNTRYFAFYGNRNVTNWVNCNTPFTFMATLPRTSPYLDAGNLYSAETGFPASLGGPTTIVSDAAGKIEGVFLIPNTPSLRFSTGTNEFVLIDISTIDYNTAISYARTSFTSSGLLYTYQPQNVRTRQLQVVTVTESLDPVIVSQTLITNPQIVSPDKNPRPPDIAAGLDGKPGGTSFGGNNGGPGTANNGMGEPGKPGGMVGIR